jgi:actin-related protein
VDNGSGVCKIGFSGDDAPRSCFPTIVGKPKPQKLMVGMDEKDIFVGHEAKELKDVMNIESPIQRGQIINWDQMVKFWVLY